MPNYLEYYNAHRSELLKQMHELGYTPRQIVEDAFKEGMSYQQYIVEFLC